MAEALDDAGVLARGLERHRFGAGEEVLDGVDAAVMVLVSGGAELRAETAFGPHPVARLDAPALLNLGRALDGATELVRTVPDAGSEAVSFTAAAARALLFDPAPEGQAFRRLALSTVAAGIRRTNASLARFFDFVASTPAPRDSGEFQAVTKPVPLDPARVYDLFDAAGLNPSGLPDLGLVARSVPREGVLVKAGTAGDEAYLLGEGKLRVSMRIPGVGEEALAVLGPGEIVGEMALIDDAPRSADVRAHEGAALVYALSREVFQKLLRSGDPAGAPLLAGIVVTLSRRLEEAIRKAAAFRMLSGFQ